MEQGIDLLGTLEALKKQVDEEKSRLDHILKGAELLAQMLTQAAKKNERREPTIEYSEPGLETAPGTGERYTI
jgi:hypothetical protein